MRVSPERSALNVDSIVLLDRSEGEREKAESPLASWVIWSGLLFSARQGHDLHFEDNTHHTLPLLNWLLQYLVLATQKYPV